MSIDRRRRALLAVVGALVLAASWGLGGGPAVAARSAGRSSGRSSAHSAGVTVDFGNGRVVHRTVTFSSASISGLDALRGAGFSVDVYGFSGMGAAVCRIDGVGRAADSSCLSGGDLYWAYWRNGTYARFGASSTPVHDHDQEQWAWGSGADAPPTTAFPPPSTAPAPTAPPVTAPPVTSPPVIAPPGSGPPVTAPPVTGPPGSGPAVTAPPVSGGGSAVPTTGSVPAAVSSTVVRAPGSATTTAPPGGSVTTTSRPQTGVASRPDPSVPAPRARLVARRAGRPDTAVWSGLGFALVLAAFAVLIVRARNRRRSSSGGAG